MDPALAAGTGPGLEALLGGLNPDQRRAVTHGDGPLLVVAGAGTGKTQVITRRIAWLIATRRARPSEILALTFTDKAAEEMAVRVDQLVPYGYTDTAISHVPRLRRPAHPRVRARARAADRRARPVAAGGRDLPARAPVRVRPRRVPAARRPDPVPRRAGDAVQPVQGRGHLARRPTWRTPTGSRPRRRGSREAAAAVDDAARRGPRRRRRRRRGGAAPGRAGPRLRDATRTLLAANGCIDFGDQVALALRLVRDVAGGAGARSPGRFRYILVDEFQDTNRAQAELVAPARRAPSERHRRRRRRPGDLRVPRRRDRQHPRLPGPLPRGADRRPAPELPLARRRSSTPPTGWSGSTTRTASRSGPGSASACAPQRVDAGRRAGPARGLRDRRRRRRTGSPPRSAAGSRPAPRRATTRPRPRQRPRRPDPAGAQHGRHPVAVLGDVRAVRPAGGPPAAGVPAGRRRPRRRASTCTPSRRPRSTGSAART